MNRPELAQAIAERAGITKRQAEKLIAALEETITESLERDDKVIYSNFGTFYTVHYPSKVIYHPKLGAAKKMVMLPTDVAKWMPSPNIKKLVNEGKIIESPTSFGNKKEFDSSKQPVETTSALPQLDQNRPLSIKDAEVLETPQGITFNHYNQSALTKKQPTEATQETLEPEAVASEEDSVEVPIRLSRSIHKQFQPNIGLDIAPTKPIKEPVSIYEETFNDGTTEEATFDGAIRLHPENKGGFWKKFGKHKEGPLGETEKVSLIDSGPFSKTTTGTPAPTLVANRPTESLPPAIQPNPIAPTLANTDNTSVSPFEYPKAATEIASPAQDQEAGSTPNALPKEEKAIKPFPASISMAPLDLSYVDLSKTIVPKEVLQQIPEKIARRYKAVPFEDKGAELAIAMIDPEDIEAKEIIKKVAQKTLTVHLATEADINHILDQYQGLESEVAEAIEEADDENKTEEEQRATVEAITDNAPAARIVTSLIRRAIRDKASDIHIEPLEKEVRVRFRIDGILYSKVQLPKHIHNAIVSRIKILSTLKIDEQRLPQDGRFSLQIDNRKVDFRVSTMPAAYGENVVMRILDKMTGILTIEQLGLSGSGLKALERNIDKAHGMILVTGPTGSGKTTTLYALIDRMHTEGVNIVTLEDPIEYQMPGINQSQVNAGIGFSFASGLRSLVRQDPDIIMIGEIRDKETAEMAVQSALTGHVVLSTLHTNESSGAAPRLTDMGIEPFLLTSSLNLIIAQRLARKLCDECKETTAINDTEAAQVKEIVSKMPAEEKSQWEQKELVLYTSKGCKSCGSTGYKGRIGIFEVLEITESIKELILKKSTSFQIQEKAIADGMITLPQDGIIKALQGQTSLEEVWRVTKD